MKATPEVIHAMVAPALAEFPIDHAGRVALEEALHGLIDECARTERVENELRAKVTEQDGLLARAAGLLITSAGVIGRYEDIHRRLKALAAGDRNGIISKGEVLDILGGRE